MAGKKEKQKNGKEKQAKGEKLNKKRDWKR